MKVRLDKRLLSRLQSYLKMYEIRILEDEGQRDELIVDMNIVKSIIEKGYYIPDNIIALPYENYQTTYEFFLNRIAETGWQEHIYKTKQK